MGTRSQVDQSKHNTKSTPKKGSKEKKGALNTSNRESRALARQQQKPDSSDESSSEHEQAGGRKSQQLQKSESEADADEEASSRESSRRPNSRRSEEVKGRGKDTLSRLKGREGRSTSRDSNGSKESLSLPRQGRGSKEASKLFVPEAVKTEEIIKEKIEPESADENGADN